MSAYSVTAGISLLIFFMLIIWLFYSDKTYNYIGATLQDEPAAVEPQICTIEDVDIDNTPTVDPNYNILVEEQICVEEEIVEPCDVKKGKFYSMGERTCRSVMEKIYGVQFPNVRPAWLINPETKRRLELDCYNERLGLAVEYNGEQHYKYPNFTGQSKQEFINQVRRDKFKREMCDKQGVYLITVPYNVKQEKIAEYIVSYLPETTKKRILEQNILAQLI